MVCQKCKSERILSVNAKCSDLCNISINGQNKNGYVPHDLGIGGGDYVEFELCLDCGQIQGQFPLAKAELEEVPESDEPVPADLLEDVDLSSAYTPPQPPADLPDPSDSIPDSSFPSSDAGPSD
jgi:hypothetical protein